MDPYQVVQYFPPMENIDIPVIEPTLTEITSKPEDGYCRLCATRASANILHSFSALNASSENILASINRLNLAIHRHDGLPQVVCSSCLQKLETLDSFVQSVTSAQSVLTAMFLPEQLTKTHSPTPDDETSSGEEIFGCGKIKREKLKGDKRKTKSKKHKKIRLEKTNKYDIQTTQPDNKLPVKSDDPFIRKWSDFFYCKRCGLQAQTLQELRQHSWSTHARCVVFKCPECVTGHVSTFKRFIRHLIKHHKTLEQCCEYCNETFASEWDVILHKKVDHPDEARPHKCNRCGSTFNCQEQLQSHQDEYVIFQSKSAGDRRIKCSICDKEFINYITLKSHMDSHDPAKNMCTICNKVYKNKYILGQHYNVVHSDQVRFICQMCGKGFKMRTHLKRHMEIHEDIRRFSCDKCDKRFRNSSQLKSHSIAHSDEPTYSCHLCSKSYKFSSGLRDHLKSHNNEKPYSCDSCQKSFLSWSNYNKHMKAIHKRNMSKLGEKTLCLR